MTRSPGSGGAPFFQAVPLYTKADTAVARYFHDHLEVVDAITGPVLTVAMPQEIADGGTEWLSRVFDRPVNEARYPGLQRADLPCVWLEDGLGAHAVLRLSNAVLGPERLIAGLTTACKGSASVPVAVKKFNEWVNREGIAASPVAFTIEENFMPKWVERLLSTLFGAAFLVALLAIAIFIPEPTPAQYNIFRIVIAVAAAGFVSMFPGFLNVQIGNWVKAGGALAVFVLVYFYDPAGLVAELPAEATGTPAVEGTTGQPATGDGAGTGN